METGTLTMQGHSLEGDRTMRYDGTLASLEGVFSGDRFEITVHDHRTGQVERIALPAAGPPGGGDERLMAAFVRVMRGGAPVLISSVEEAQESHLMSLAAEESRVRGEVIDMADYRQRAAQSAFAT